MLSIEQSLNGATFEIAIFKCLLVSIHVIDWFFVLVLVLNEMVLVLDAVSSSTSTANAEYEYEKQPKLRNVKTNA